MERENKNRNCAFCDGCKSDISDRNTFDDFFWLFVIFFLAMPFGGNSSKESYLNGKVDAYENILKGFDDNVW